MPVKKYRPTTPSLRQRQVLDFDQITTDKPEKSLVKVYKNKAGRNNAGRITVRHRGGGRKRSFRIIDFKRTKTGVEGVIKSVEYDPNRSANISLVQFMDGEKCYIITPVGLKVGDKIQNGESAEITVGNSLPLANIPVGSTIHNIELTAGAGAVLARSAGVSATIVARNNNYATVKLPSGEVRLINIKCRATLGQVANQDHRNQVLGKAGASRWRRRRPTVRGSVMNPCDHPHGGGEGRAPVGRSGPMTPWGKPALGLKTRKSKKISTRFIQKRRK